MVHCVCGTKNLEFSFCCKILIDGVPWCHDFSLTSFGILIWTSRSFTAKPKKTFFLIHPLIKQIVGNTTTDILSFKCLKGQQYTPVNHIQVCTALDPPKPQTTQYLSAVLELLFKYHCENFSKKHETCNCPWESTFFKSFQSCFKIFVALFQPSKVLQVKMKIVSFVVFSTSALKAFAPCVSMCVFLYLGKLPSINCLRAILLFRESVSIAIWKTQSQIPPQQQSRTFHRCHT